MVCATNTAFSSRRFETDGRLRRPTNGCSIGNPWEIARPESGADVGFGGHTETYSDASGEQRVRWVPDRIVRGIPYDTLIPGHCNNTVNSLRLWKAEAPERFDFAAFNVGDYYGSVREKVQLENISKILYPNDDNIKGKELRLEQQFFFVSCSLQDMIKHHKHRGGLIEDFDQKNALQLNDTHPSIGVAELMRLLVDIHHVGWDAAWRITQNTFGYTNHTLLPEALERWPIQIVRRVCCRAIWRSFMRSTAGFWMKSASKYPGDEGTRFQALVDRRIGRAIRPHGQPGQRREPRHQRRCGSAHGTAEEGRAARLLRNVSGALQQ